MWCPGDVEAETYNVLNYSVVFFILNLDFRLFKGVFCGDYYVQEDWTFWQGRNGCLPMKDITSLGEYLKGVFTATKLFYFLVDAGDS